MRQRFRVMDELFAAETFACGHHFEVKVFPIRPSESYFKRESASPIVCLRGTDERALVLEAIVRTRAQFPKRGARR